MLDARMGMLNRNLPKPKDDEFDVIL
jgi:hypothetical protein